MNPIKIPKNLINKTIDEYLEYIQQNEYDFNIDNRIIHNVLNLIKNKNKLFEEYSKNFLYLIYNMIYNNDIIPVLDDEQKPDGGIEFINKNTGEFLSVYHIHLSDKNNSVIIWYPYIQNKEIYLNFIYLDKHPIDDYEAILNNIYDSENGYHIDKYKLFRKLNKLLNENMITDFWNFIKNKF